MPTTEGSWRTQRWQSRANWGMLAFAFVVLLIGSLFIGRYAVDAKQAADRANRAATQSEQVTLKAHTAIERAQTAVIDEQNLSRCLLGNQLQTITALRARSDLTDQATSAEDNFDKEIKHFIDVIGTPNATEAQRKVAFQAFQQALNRKVATSNRLSKVRATFAFPSESDVLGCTHVGQ